MSDNKNKGYNTGFNGNSFDFYPDFDSLEKAKPAEPDAVQRQETATPIQPQTTEPVHEQPQKKAKKKSAFVPLCIALVVAIIVTSVLSVFSFAGMFDSDEGLPRPSAEETQNIYTSTAAKYETAKYPSNLNTKLAKLYATNNDTVGWLYVPGTSINMPIVQTDTNNKYIRYNFFGSYTTYGTVFSDYRCKKETLSKNTVIYGHNLFNGTHFYDVSRYDDIEWYRQHPVIYYDTLNSSYTFLVYAAFYSTGSAKQFNGGYYFNYIYPNMGPQSFKGYIKQLDYRAIYTTGVGLNSDDRIVTLSTCTHALDKVCGQDIDGRLVVVGRLLRSGESAEVDTSKAKENNDYLRPLIWYTKLGKKVPYSDSTAWVPSEK